MKIVNNPNRRIAYGCIFIIVAGACLIFFPGLTGMDGMKGGFALSFFGFFLALIGVITVIIFMRLAIIQDKAINENTILAHWVYGPEEWRHYVEKEHTEDASDKRSLFLLIAAISVIVGIILFFIFPDDWLITFFTILGIIVIIGITALISTFSVYRWNKNHPGEIYIARDGAYFSGRLHIWKGLGTRLMSIVYENTHRSPRITIQYSSPNYLTRNSYIVRIPVPLGQEGSAQKVIEAIKSAHLR